MPIANDRIGPIKKPRKPVRPAGASAPVTPPTYTTAEQPSWKSFKETNAPRVAPSTSRVSTQSSAREQSSIALDAVAALHQRQNNKLNPDVSLTPIQIMQARQRNGVPAVGKFRQFYDIDFQNANDNTELNLVSQSTATESPAPYSNYADSMQGQYLQGNESTSVRTYDPGEDRSTIDTTSADGIKKMIARRLSRRGGAGIVNPRSPIAGYEIGPGYDSDFGFQADDPAGPGSRFHTGDDISMPGGTPVLAPVGGVVSSSAATGGAYGNQVILDYGAGQQGMFAHLSQLAVPPGTKVKKGEVIGYVGSTGRSTGNHLHQETWKDGEPFDPSQAYGDNFNQEQVGRIISQKAERYAQNNPETLVPVANVTPEQPLNTAAKDAFNSRAFKHMPQVGDPVDSYSQPQQANPQGQQLAQNPQLNALMQAIREQESGGDYSVQNGIGASGAFQIMPQNIEKPGGGGWDVEALGREITGQEFLNSPQLQNNIAKFKLKDYFKKYGAAGAAKAWYAGPGNATLNSDGPQNGGPSVNDYAENVLNLMRKYMPNSGQ